jgi:hypothetical protein
LSKQQIKKLGGIKGQPISIRSYLIGQIGKNHSIPDNPLNLQSILDEIYPIIYQIRAGIGGRCIILECSEILVGLYSRHGFTSVGTPEPDADGEVRDDVTMLKVISS